LKSFVKEQLVLRGQLVLVEVDHLGQLGQLGQLDRLVLLVQPDPQVEKKEILVRLVLPEQMVL
jgi:hypothetical protein